MAGPERHAPARLLLCAAALLMAVPAAATMVQAPAPVPAAPAPAPAPSAAIEPELVNRLLWSTMAAVDQANRTGNYSVLRDLASPAFQARTPLATLVQAFAPLRTQQLDLSYTLIVTPTFEFPPAVGADGVLRIRGVFPLRPTAIGFDMLFQNVGGQWRISALAVIPLVARPQQSGSTRR